MPNALANAIYERDVTQSVFIEIREILKDLLRAVEPDVGPDEEQVEPEPHASLQLASFGVQVAHIEKKMIRLERDVVVEKRDIGLYTRIMYSVAADKRLRGLRQRYLSAGGDLWRHQKKKRKLEDPGAIQLFRPGDSGISECLLALYAKCDGFSKVKSRPSHWRQDALAYYSGNGYMQGRSINDTWCHISGDWHKSKDVEAAHIVPFFADCESAGEMLFGRRSESLSRAGNALLLSKHIKEWFDTYHLVVVPVDAAETPITRWRTDVISTDIENPVYAVNDPADYLDGKEVVFLNNNRPAPRFLYFHFIMALVRIKDIRLRGWEDTWARYYEQPPFPTPGKYMRKSMLFALATHFETIEMRVVESWLVGHGFDSPLKLTVDEATEAARRVHLAVEAAVSRAEKQEEGLEEESSEEGRSEGTLGGSLEEEY